MVVGVGSCGAWPCFLGGVGVVVSLVVDEGLLASEIAGVRDGVSALSAGFAPDCSGVGDASVLGACTALVGALESSRQSLVEQAAVLEEFLGSVRVSTDAVDGGLAGSADKVAGPVPSPGLGGSW